MEPIEKSEYEKRLARISELFAKIALHADEQALTRCPYKNRFDECTAKFGCGYQRAPRNGTASWPSSKVRSPLLR